MQDRDAQRVLDALEAYIAAPAYTGPPTEAAVRAAFLAGAILGRALAQAAAEGRHGVGAVG